MIGQVKYQISTKWHPLEMMHFEIAKQAVALTRRGELVNSADCMHLLLCIQTIDFDLCVILFIFSMDLV